MKGPRSSLFFWKHPSWAKWSLCWGEESHSLPAEVPTCSEPALVITSIYRVTKNIKANWMKGEWGDKQTLHLQLTLGFQWVHIIPLVSINSEFLSLSLTPRPVRWDVLVLTPLPTQSQVSPRGPRKTISAPHTFSFFLLCICTCMYVCVCTYVHICVGTCVCTGVPCTCVTCMWGPRLLLGVFFGSFLLAYSLLQ